MFPLRQSTASQEVPLGHFLDSTDGNTEETGLTIANTDIKLHKAGGTSLTNKNSGGGTHMATGVYYAVLDATDTDTVGPLVIFVHVSGALAVKLDCFVFEEAIYDAFYAASAPGYIANAPVNLAQWKGSVPANLADTDKVSASVQHMANNIINAAVIADGAIDNATFASDTLVPSIRQATAQAGAAGSITLDTNASATNDFYNNTLVYIVSGTGAGQVRRAYDYDGSSKVLSVVPNWTTNPNNTSVFVLMPATSSWDERTTDHQATGTTGKALTDAASAGDPWSTALPGAYSTGQAGKIIGDNINATITSRASQTSVDDVPNNAEMLNFIRILVRKDAALATDLASIITSINGNTGTGTGTFANTTDALEALRDRGDAAWTTVTEAVIRTAIGLAVANLDSQLADKSGYALSAAGIDAILDDAIEGSITLRQAVRGILSACLAIVSGAAPSGGTVIFRDANNTVNRITATVDANGNRSAVVLNLT